MRWYVLLALVVIVTLLFIQESEEWGGRRRRRGGWRRVVRRPRVRTRRLRRAVRVRTRRLRRAVRFRTRRLRRAVRFRTRRLRRAVRFRTRRLRRAVRFRTRRLRRAVRFRTRKFRRIRFNARRLVRIRTRKILKKFKIKKLTRKVKKLLKKAKKILPLKKPKLWSKIKDWIKGKLKPGKALLQKWLSTLKGLTSKGKKPPEPEEGTSGPGVQPTAAPPPTEDPFLVVKQGAFTFEAEGDDNSSSPYFSRKLHVFSNTSGVTVGRGYDVKDKMILDIKRDLTVVGIQNSVAVKLMNAIHLEGDRAKLWIKNNKLESFTITTQQQKKLFELEYPRQLNKAKRMVEKYSKTGLKFDQLKQVVKDMIVDIFYRGDYSMNNFDQGKKERSQDMQEVFDQSKTSLKPMTVMMLEEEDFWIIGVGVDRGRFNIRANYMADACEKVTECKGS